MTMPMVLSITHRRIKAVDTVAVIHLPYKASNGNHDSHDTFYLPWESDGAEIYSKILNLDQIYIEKYDV